MPLNFGGPTINPAGVMASMADANYKDALVRQHQEQAAKDAFYMKLNQAKFDAERDKEARELQMEMAKQNALSEIAEGVPDDKKHLVRLLFASGMAKEGLAAAGIGRDDAKLAFGDLNNMAGWLGKYTDQGQYDERLSSLLGAGVLPKELAEKLRNPQMRALLNNFYSDKKFETEEYDTKDLVEMVGGVPKHVRYVVNKRGETVKRVELGEAQPKGRSFGEEMADWEQARETRAARDKASEALEEVQRGIETIASAIGQAEKRPDVVGATGKVQSAIESAKGTANNIVRIAGGKPVWSVDTSSALFENTIMLMRSGARRLADTGRLSDQDMQFVRNIVNGDAWTSTPETFIATSRNLMSMMRRQENDLRVASGRLVKPTPEQVEAWNRASPEQQEFLRTERPHIAWPK